MNKVASKNLGETDLDRMKESQHNYSIQSKHHSSNASEGEEVDEKEVRKSLIYSSNKSVRGMTAPVNKIYPGQSDLDLVN